MNKYLKAGFLPVFIALLCIQTYSQEVLLPVDNKVKIGKLENGLTYYIRQNKKPENRFELRLAINAGSILENDDQQGLAHFVEHMCFNGTKNFEKNELIHYLQSMGMKFGPEINAYTSFDETVYMLSIPSDSSELIEKGFLVLEDWAHNVTFSNEEIDKERGVIIEEWRIGQGPNQRMRDKYLPVVFKDSKYAERLPIGKKEILENFNYETLKEYYRTWYRPDLMAVVVVGDIDPELAEKKVIEHFSNLKSQENSLKREEFKIPDNESTLISIASDKEAPMSMVQIMYKSDANIIKTESEYVSSLRFSFITGILNRRLAELTESSDPPFIGAGIYYGSMYARTKNALQVYAAVGETGIERGIKTLLEESIRAAKFGFTQGEFERYKLDFLKGMEQLYLERDKTESENLADEYIRNYLEQEPIPGIEFEYEIVKNNIDKIKLEDVNKLAAGLIKPNNRIIIATTPEKEGIVVPSEAKILSLAQETDNAELSPYDDKLASAELMKEIPSGGKIVKETKIESINAIEIKLSNGATVLLKPTEFKNDEIQLSGFAWGGSSIYADEDNFSALHADGIVEESGVADFAPSALTKLLAGKTVYVATSIGTETQEVSANCRPADLETMLQLMYLKFTSPRVDEESFNSYISKYKNLYKNLAQDPMNYFYDKYNRIRAQNHPRGNYLPLESDWDKVNFDRAIEIYKDRFSNAGEFTFIVVGSFNIDSIKPIIAKYIGGLPSTGREANYRDLGIRPPKGMISEKILKGTDDKSMAIVAFNKEIQYDKTDAFIMSQLAQYLNRKYIDILREEMSGVYGVRTSAGLYKVPYQRAGLSISIPCKPSNVDSLIAAALLEIKKVQENGIEDKEVSTAREIYKREKEKNLMENSFWLGAIKSAYMYNNDFAEISSYEIMEKITSEEFKRVAKTYIDSDNYLRVVLYPENQ